ncbi:hypothetical protein [Kribbella sindirgiensis]|uniref:Uncharacterized protein n=1 Tax=Kribbella sindirgiensis TaxID=1124744 RepID=A0A4R0IU98_9ACTN|nr:hypothetical protein [Kribbella sindirgiensis]TCC35106.1 hypothetical protein E0H50_14670 [Kribbella sindirgiensis]
MLPEDSERVRALNPYERITLEIGRVAREHVRMDVGLRHIYRQLVAPSPAVLLTANITSTYQVINDIRLMIVMSAPFEDPAVANAAIEILDTAKVVNADRNRVVHDMWIPMPSATEPRSVEWLTKRLVRGEVDLVEQGPKDLVYARGVWDHLRRVTKRLDALAWFLQTVLPIYDEFDWDETQLPMWTAMLEGRFDLLNPDGVSLRPPR